MHIKNYINFNYRGLNSDEDFNIIVTKINNLSFSERNLSVEEIDGSNNPLVIDKKNYKPFYLDIECTIEAKNEDLKDLARRVRTWLQENPSFDKLEISNEPEFHYEAICFNKLDISEVIEILGEFKITFLCKPLKKSKSGEEIIVIDKPQPLYNEYCSSEPYIKVVGSGDITISINNQNLILEGIEGEIIIDRRIMNAYKMVNGLIEFQNDKMYSEFPIFKHGLNNISWLGNVSYLEIIPRWEE